jgi:hypothetical protein
MKTKGHFHSNLYKALVLLVCILTLSRLNAQTSSDTLNGRNLYRPNSINRQNQDTSYEKQEAFIQVNQDSIDARMRFIQDSIAIRMQFIQDSIIARQIFVRDSIQRRKEILDSLKFLKIELPRLLEASLKNYSEDIIILNNQIHIVGDSMLSNYLSLVLPFTIDQPYRPWEIKINLSNSPPNLVIDTNANKITAIQSPELSCAFAYSKRNNILIIKGKSSILNKQGGKLYKVPVDSIWFSRQGKVLKIKKYIQFYQVTSQYHRGAFIFNHLSQVKQYEYGPNNNLTKCQITKFCDRWKAQDPRKVCNNMNYLIMKQGNSYILTRTTDPVNKFADGKFTYEFDSKNTLKTVSFVNTGNSENWKTIVEVNDAGYVSRYVYQNKGAVHKTLLVNYYLDDPRAKHKVETITCLFEDDGVSYYQVNNATGKTRQRDKMTMEWSPWR